MFIDTNILVNSRVAEAPDHQVARTLLRDAMRSGEPVTISRQVVREYLSVMTCPQVWPVSITMSQAVEDARNLIGAYQVLEDGPRVTLTLLALCSQAQVGGRQIHHANIVAIMLAHGERRFLTLNTSDFRRYGDRIELFG